MADYRDELAAAHQRIADLEAKLAGRDAPPAGLLIDESPLARPIAPAQKPPVWTIVVAVVLAALDLVWGCWGEPTALRLVVCVSVTFLVGCAGVAAIAGS